MGFIKKFIGSKDSEPEIEIMRIGDEEYKTVKIGKQVWMAENLKITQYRNGEPIPNVTGASEWDRLSTGARCSYGNNESNANTYGYLYNWFAVADNRKIAPEGWHAPTDQEWKELEMHLGMSQLYADNLKWRGTNEGSKLAGRADLWDDGLHGLLKGNAAFGESGFSALPGGFRDGSGSFRLFGSYAGFWSATEASTSLAFYRALYCDKSDVVRDDDCPMQGGSSVRLVKD